MKETSSNADNFIIESYLCSSGFLLCDLCGLCGSIPNLALQADAFDAVVGE